MAKTSTQTPEPKSSLEQFLGDGITRGDAIDLFVVGHRLGLRAARLQLHEDFVTEDRRGIAEGEADGTTGSLPEAG